MRNIEKEKAELIKKSLLLVQKIANSDIGDLDGKFTSDDFDSEGLLLLVEDAKKIISNVHWKLT
jgi:hypothetical protein